MKKLLLILLCLPMIGFGQNVNIPDANFKAYLVLDSNINTNGDTEIQVSEATAFNGQINCSNMNISDLTGIEDFVALTSLICSDNQLTSLDVSQNTALTSLNCFLNQLTSLDVSNNTDLSNLQCHNQPLANLDVSTNTDLNTLVCANNQLTSLDLSNNTNLVHLQCQGNSLTSLDLRNGNNLSFYGLNAANNPNLNCIDVDDNLWSANNWNNIDSWASFSLNCPSYGCTDSTALNFNPLADTDDGSCTYQMTYVPDNNFEAYLESNGMGNGLPNDDYVTTANINAVTYLFISNIGASNLIGIEDFTDLTLLDCSNNQLINLDVSANLALTNLNTVGNNQLVFLDVSSNTDLIHLDCQNNGLTNLDVSSNTSLTKLWISGNNLSTLDISNNLLLTSLVLSYNNISYIDISNHLSLQHLSISGTNITTLDLSNNINLKVLWMRSSQLNTLDVSNNINLKNLHSANSQLTSLDLSNNPDLVYLNCHNNNLTYLDLRNGNNSSMIGSFFSSHPTAGTPLGSNSSVDSALFIGQNPLLLCIDVDDTTWSTTNWTVANQNIDSWNNFSNNCATTVLGCTDSLACNYDPSATIDDGSCTYSSSDTTTETACDTYTWVVNGFTYSTSGIYTYTYTNVAGCDSLVSIDLTVNYSTSSTTTITACDTYTWAIDGNTYTTSGIYVNASDCMGIVNGVALIDSCGDCQEAFIYNMITHDPSEIVMLGGDTNGISATLLPGQVIVLPDNPANPYWNSGCNPNNWVSNNTGGCTHTDSLFLTINNSTSNSTTATTCDSYTWAVDGNTYTTSGTYTNVSTNASGCGHTETLNLTINNSTSNSTTATACDSYTWAADGNTYTTSGIYTDISTNAGGCNHTETLELTINNSTSSTDTHLACDEFMWYCDGNTYTTSNNTATYTYANAAGCDSVVTLDLTINNSTSNSTTATTCDSYTWAADGNTYTTSGTYTDISTNAGGCDHTETLELTINYSPNTTNILGVTNVEFLQIETYSVGQNLNSIFSWHLNNGGIIVNGINTNSVEVQWGSIDGSYDLYVIETTQDGCSDTALIVVNANCLPNASTSTISACDSYTWDGMAFTESGTYTNTYTNTSGCDSVHTLDLTIYSLIASISQSGDNLSAVTTPVGLNANWFNIQTEDSTTRTWLMEEDASSFTPTFDCSYFIVVEDMGCTDTSEIYAYGENAARIGSFTTSPNPTTGLINVKFDNPKSQFVMLELISNNGSKLDEFITIDNSLNIDLSKYPSGSYYLYFNSEDAVQGCRLEEVQKISTKIILNK